MIDKDSKKHGTVGEASNTALERVAKVLSRCFDEPMDGMQWDTWPRYVPVAQAVLRAIHEPGDDAIRPGAEYLADVTDAGGLADLIMTEAWQRVIDAILSE